MARTRVVRGNSLQKIQGLLRSLQMIELDSDNAAFANVKGAFPPRFVFYDDNQVLKAIAILKNRCNFAINVRYDNGKIDGQRL